MDALIVTVKQDGKQGGMEQKRAATKCPTGVKYERCGLLACFDAPILHLLDELTLDEGTNQIL